MTPVKTSTELFVIDEAQNMVVHAPTGVPFFRHTHKPVNPHVAERAVNARSPNPKLKKFRELYSQFSNDGSNFLLIDDHPTLASTLVASAHGICSGCFRFCFEMNRNRDMQIQTHRTVTSTCSKIPFKSGIVNTMAYSTGVYPPIFYVIRDSIDDDDLLSLAASRDPKPESHLEPKIDISSLKRTPPVDSKDENKEEDSTVKVKKQKKSIPAQKLDTTPQKKASVLPHPHVPIAIPHKATEVSEHPLQKAITSFVTDLKTISEESKRYYKPKNHQIVEATNAFFAGTPTSAAVLAYTLLCYVIDCIDPNLHGFKFLLHPTNHTLTITNERLKFKLFLQIVPPESPLSTWNTSIWLTGEEDTINQTTPITKRLPLIDRLQGSSISFAQVCTVLVIFRAVAKTILSYVSSGAEVSDRLILWGLVKRAFEESEFDNDVATSIVKRYIAHKVGQ